MCYLSKLIILQKILYKLIILLFLIFVHFQIRTAELNRLTKLVQTSNGINAIWLNHICMYMVTGNCPSRLIERAMVNHIAMVQLDMIQKDLEK